MRSRCFVTSMLILASRCRLTQCAMQGFPSFLLQVQACNSIGGFYYKVKFHLRCFSSRSSFPPLAIYSWDLLSFRKAIMPSYFRSFFIGHSSSSPQNNSKSHKRSASASSAAAVNPNLSYIYAASGRTPSAASREGRERSQHAARINYNGSSPLRYPTYDAGSVSSKESSSQALLHVPPPQQPSIQQKPTRMHLYRTTGNAPGDRRPCWFEFFISGVD